MKKKKTLKKNSNSPYNLLVYVEYASAKIKRFETTEEMGAFVDNFYKEHPDYADYGSDFWIDYAITDVSGDVHFFTDGLAVE